MTELARRISESPRLRVTRLVRETSPRLAVVMALYVLADGVLPILALISLGRAVGKIPAAVTHGLTSASGHALLLALGIGTAAYALSLLRSPAESLLSAYCAAAMSTGMQRRLARAVSAPEGVEHLEDPRVLDRLASASGELAASGPADAPMALASSAGDRLSGLLACVTLATFRWWVGLLFFVGWTAIRPPLRRMLAARATMVRQATPDLRHAWYYLGCSYRPEFAKETRLFGLGDWILARHRTAWLTGMSRPWRQLRHFQNRTLLFGLLVAGMYVIGAGALALAAYHHAVSGGTLAVMLPMFPSTMQVGGVSAADVSLEQMLASVPDLDAVITQLRAVPLPGAADAAGTAAGLPVRAIRFEGLRYQYPGTERPVFEDLNLELTAGQSLGLVGINGAGKTTLVTLLARLREPGGGRITIDGVDVRELDARSWQRQVAVVYQDFTRYPLTARENVGFRDLDGHIDQKAAEEAAAQAGALEVITGLPAGWDTICFPGYAGGIDLSGGQWQRIALARALYSVARGARVLVLDEPTAQLDVRAEAAFYGRFLELTAGLTTVVISHRFATVRRADRIAVLDGGQITELGSHDELLAAGGSYAEMFRLQAAQFQAAHR
ncbi:MAG TPA: ATP-binding cassette domain-containing protein [Streptosporangiaceae bacterium]|nr:ATP-binding cassette domain-containing protein [Streptosporangiaceae bacterium]